jgi:hypothetical protein
MRLSLGITPKSYFNLAVPNDTDAQAFITAAGITDATQQSAVNQLVLNLKSANIWTKMKAIYPIVGGTATTHKWNLKDPRDLDAAFRLTFSTGWTHSSNGMQGNGTSSLADTFITPSLILSLNNTHVSIYSRTNNFNAFTTDVGVQDGSSNSITLSLRNNSDACNTRINEGFTASWGTNTNSACFFIGNRTASNVRKTFINGILVNNNTTASTGLATTKIGIGANYYNNLPGSSNYFSNRQYAFASIGDGLTDTEAANFYTAVQNYNTTLGRQV